MSKELTIEEKVKIWKSRFISRTDCFNIDLTRYDKVSSDPNEKVSKYQFMKYDEKEKWIPLDDSHIKDHITGKAPVALFTKNLQDQLHFGVIDFDYPWDYVDVVEVQKLVSQTYNVPCYISSSSRKGWHLTFFFAEWFDMRVFISFWEHIYVESGLAKSVYEGRMDANGKYYKIPEIFPAKTSYGDNNVMSTSCKAIKPPMVENRFQYGKNCYYKELEDTPIQVVDQWEYLANTVQLTTEYMNSVMSSHNIPLIDKVNPLRIRAPKGTENGFDFDNEAIKPKGNFLKVAKGCPALADALSKDCPDHASRVALGIIAAHCVGGLEDLLELVKLKTGWDADKTRKYVVGIIDKGYIVPTCKKLQETGVCKKGIHPTKGNKDHCLEPRKDDDGNDKEPSPYRFALKNNKKDEATFSKLSAPIRAALEALNSCAAENLKRGDARYDKASKTLRESVIVAMSQKDDMSGDDRAQLDDLISSLGFGKTDEKNLKKEASTRRRDETNKEIASDRSIISMTNAKYTERDNRYVMINMDDKGNLKENILCEFIVVVEKEIKRIRNLQSLNSVSGKSATNMYYSGYLKTADMYGKCKSSEHKFTNLSASDFFEPRLNVFIKKLSSTAGLDIVITPGMEPHVRNCISAFKKYRNIAKKYLVVDEAGWNKDVYLVENMMITKEGIKKTDYEHNVEGEDYRVELNERDWHSRMPDVPYDRSGRPYFEDLNREDMRDLLIHINRDFLTWHGSTITFTGLGFVLAAAIQDLIGNNVATSFSPTLFYVGLSGKGKTEVLKALQKFFGPWNNVIKFSSKSTIKSIHDVLTYFNDMVVCMDDYKKNVMKSSDLTGIIQSTYDRGQRSRLEKDGQAKDVQPSQAFVVMGGEDIFENETSVAARCLIVDFHQYSKQENNREQFDKVLANKDKYSAITANVILYCLQMQAEEGNSKKLLDWFIEGQRIFKASEEHAHDNADRVSKNIALLYVGFKAYLEMCLKKYNVIDERQYELLYAEMISCYNRVVMHTFSKITEDKAGTSFIREIAELLSSEGGKYFINGIGERPTIGTSVCIGWKDPKEIGVINIMPSVVISVLKNKYKNDRAFQSEKTIGMTLLEDGHVVNFHEKEKPFRRLRNPLSGTKVNVLSIRTTSLFGDDVDYDSSSDFDAPPYGQTKTVKNYAPGAQ